MVNLLAFCFNPLAPLVLIGTTIINYFVMESVSVHYHKNYIAWLTSKLLVPKNRMPLSLTLQILSYFEVWKPEMLSVSHYSVGMHYCVTIIKYKSFLLRNHTSLEIPTNLNFLSSRLCIVKIRSTLNHKKCKLLNIFIRVHFNIKIKKWITIFIFFFHSLQVWQHLSKEVG